MDAATEGALQSKYRNAGQTCVCANSFLVQTGIADAFVAKIVSRISALKVGDGLVSGTQVGPLISEKAILNIDQILVTVTYVPCYSTDITAEAFTNLIKESAVIITQPIKENYREQFYLSTQYIIETASKDCKIIIYDSCHFDFYYFDLTYKWLNGTVFKEPCDYHYNGFITTYKDKLTIDAYLANYVNNPNLKLPEELETLANKSLDELKRRYNSTCEKYGSYTNVSVISVYEYVKTNYKDKLLFYSMNHPTNILIQYICEEISKLIPIQCNINYTIDLLADYKGILYKCVQSVVRFNIDNHMPLTCKTSSLQEIAKVYYVTYDKIGYDTINQLI